jgi:hypothetical protein
MFTKTTTQHGDKLTCLQPTTTGIMHSGSVAWVDSSTSTDLKRNLDNRGSPAPTQVVHITSAF